MAIVTSRSPITAEELFELRDQGGDVLPGFRSPVKHLFPRTANRDEPRIRVLARPGASRKCTTQDSKGELGCEDVFSVKLSWSEVRPNPKMVHSIRYGPEIGKLR